MRVRFAPSPTGSLHLGGLRTALFNYLLARSSGPEGRFLLRIEDTDAKRTVAGSEAGIVDSLRWLGITPDEEMVRQSERLPLYQEHAHALLDRRLAFRCFCAEGEHTPQCASRPPGAVADRHAPYAVRVALPETSREPFSDLVFGPLSLRRSALGATRDFVVLKRDGFPTYHLASVVDDHAMRVSHVLRGEEWISSLPKHLRLYELLGWAPPRFGHLPLLLNMQPGAGKLSKRDGSVAAASFQDDYLPSAMANFLALLGWKPSGDTDEVFAGLPQLAARFALRDVNRAGARVDIARLRWLNKQHLRLHSHDPALVAQLQRLLLLQYPAEAAKLADLDFVQRLLVLHRDRVSLLPEIPGLAAPLFRAPTPPTTPPSAQDRRIVATFLRLCPLPCPSGEAGGDALRATCAELGLEAPAVLRVLRAALLGQRTGPGVLDTLPFLAAAEIRARAQTYLARS